MPFDWVPCQQYDTGNLDVPQGSQATIGLMNNASWSAPIEVIGDIEGEDVGYRIKRIVGYFSWFVNDGAPTNGEAYMRLWPGFQDQDAGEPLVPGILATGLLANSDDVGLAANEKWWAERITPASWINLPPAGGWNLISNSNHPWHCFIDIKPNWYCPPNMVPCLSIYNGTNSVGNLRFIHRFRMLVSHR